jgi:competence protein ComEC
LWRATAPAWWFAAAIPAALVWLCAWPWALRVGASCALLPLVFAPANGPVSGAASISVLDAGRGSVALVRTRHHALLFDTGDSWNTRGSRLAVIVLPALDAARIRRVDRLLLPGPDDDRARAAALLAVDRGLDEVWTARPWPGNGLAVSCRDRTWVWDDVRFEVLVAGADCVLRVAAGRKSVLFPGDLDAAAERALLARLRPGEFRSDVVLMGRQAGESASSAEWIEGTAPGLAIATGGVEGAQSRRRVIERWRGRGSRVLDTRDDGGIEFDLSAHGVSVRAIARYSRFPFHWRRASDHPG